MKFGLSSHKNDFLTLTTSEGAQWFCQTLHVSKSGQNTEKNEVVKLLNLLIFRLWVFQDIQEVSSYKFAILKVWLQSRAIAHFVH